MKTHRLAKKSRFLRGSPIDPKPIRKDATVTDLIEKHFQAFNAGRISEACRLYAEKMLKGNVTIGMTLAGALAPAGLGGSCIVPLMEAGFVDWIVSTGANLYHDTHFAIGHTLHRGSPFLDDRLLRKEAVIRIYDILFRYEVLLDTDEFFRTIMTGPEFQKEMSTAEFHHHLGKYVHERERLLKRPYRSILGTAYRLGIPVFTSSPGDSSIGMNVAETQLYGNRFRFNVLADVNQSASIVLEAKQTGGRSGVLVFGGGSPKNFILQTEPQIQEVLKIDEKGHDFFIQFTDARPDTGGLSGATPSEAVSWGKIDPDRLPDSIVAYVDSTIAMPLLTSYALARRKPRAQKRLYHRLDHFMQRLTRAAAKAKKKSNA